MNQKMIIRGLVKSLATALIGAGLFLSVRPVSASSQNCVYYETEKTMFYVTDVAVRGVNCQIRVKIEKSGPGLRAVVTIPIAGFDSDNGSRDEHVAEILGRAGKPSLVFISEIRTRADWETTFGEKEFVLAGFLKIGNDSYPVKIPCVLSNAGGKKMLAGEFKTSFRNFGMEPPTAGGGVMANANDWLKLGFSMAVPPFPDDFSGQ